MAESHNAHRMGSSEEVLRGLAGPALRRNWEALEEEVATGGTARGHDMKEEAVCRRDGPEGMQQEQSAVGGRRPCQKESCKDEQPERVYQVATG
jgi:hypothetical protein